MLVSNVQKNDYYTYIYLFFSNLLLQSIEFPVLYSGPCWLPILNTAEHISTPNSLPIPPAGNYKLI